MAGQVQLASSLEEFCDIEPMHVEQWEKFVQVEHNYEQF
jgi:hypothetical protein